MANNVAVTKGNFPFNRLAAVLKLKRKICIVGYEFSWESRLPHFKDILKGVWSDISENSRINPFTSPNDYGVVLNWLDWRRQSIRKAAVTFEPFQMLFRMQKDDPRFTIASQCVDGLMSTNGFENALELYGNVFQAICFDNGHRFSSWPKFGEINQRLTCEICGSALLPNVEMFGWNRNEEIKSYLLEEMNKAGALILIGIDKELAPFNGMNLVKLPTIEVLQDGILFVEGASTYMASINDIEKFTGEKISTSGERSFGRTIGCLSQIKDWK